MPLSVKIQLPDAFLGEFEEYERISRDYNRTTSGQATYTNPDTSASYDTTGTTYDGMGESGLALLLYNEDPILKTYIYDDETYEDTADAIEQSMTPYQPSSGTSTDIILTTASDYESFILDIPNTISGANITINVNGTGAKNLYSDYALTENTTELEAGIYKIFDRSSAFFLASSSVGSKGWLQQYDGANSILKDEKDKDITVKKDQYVNNEFYETAIVPSNGDNKVKVLLHMNGTDTSTDFTDETGFQEWTANGNAQIDTAESKFGGASGLFDGTGDSIDTPASDLFSLSDNDFTIDFWFKRATSGVLEFLCGQVDSSDTDASKSFDIYFVAGNQMYGRIKDGATSYIAVGSTAITDTNWHHVAFIRNGNDLNLYLDGTLDGTDDVTGATVNKSSNKLSVGVAGERTVNYFNGHIDEFRFVNGEAKWTTNFTPPTAEYDFSASQIIPPITSVTDTLKSLMHMDGTDGSTTFTDDTGREWTANGNAQIDTAESKFGGASGLFDNAGNSCITADSVDDIVFSTYKDFTIDFWFKKNLDSVRQYLFALRDLSTQIVIALRLEADNTIDVLIDNTAYSSVATVTVDSLFHHGAIVNKDGIVDVYLDGTSVINQDITALTLETPVDFTIGALSTTTGSDYDGWIDEFRFVNGEAKWTTNFTPPTQAYVYEDESNPNHQALIDGTLEMNELVDDTLEDPNKPVYNGWVSNENLWNSDMEGQFPIVDSFGTLGIDGSSTNSIVVTQRVNASGKGKVKCIANTDNALNDYFHLVIDGVRYPSSDQYRFSDSSSLVIDYPFDSSFEFHTSGDKFITIYELEGELLMSEPSTGSASGSLKIDVSGSGKLTGLSLDTGYVSIEIDGEFVFGTSGTSKIVEEGSLYFDYEFTTGFKVYSSGSYVNASYQLD